MSKSISFSRRQVLGRLNARTITSHRNMVDVAGAPKLQSHTTSSSTSASNPFILSNKHGDFKKVQAKRPDFDKTLPIEVTKTPDPEWKYGKGVNDKSKQALQHVEIDPYHPDRQMISNYKVLVSGIPRPISFVSTISKDGRRNLAPFSYFQVVDHDPPILVIGFSARASRPKDTRANLVETAECVISVVSEHMVEAVNGTSLDVPHGTSEWELSGLHAAPSSTVRPERVKDAVFSIEAKLLEMKEMNYGTHAAGKPSGALAIVQATRFWVREDALNETKENIDLAKLRPLVQLGGISYGRVRETFELPRPALQAELEDESKGLLPFLDQNS